MAEVKVNEMLRLCIRGQSLACGRLETWCLRLGTCIAVEARRRTVRHKAAKVAADNAVPGWALSLVKLFQASDGSVWFHEVAARDAGWSPWATLTVRLMCWAMSCQVNLV